MANNRTKTLFKETAWFAFGNFGSKVLTLLMVPLYTNILTTKEYGNLDILTTTISLAIPVLTLSLQDAAFRYSFETGIEKKAVLSDCLIVTVLSSLVLFLLYPILYYFLPIITTYWWFFFGIYFFNSISSVLSCFLKGIGKSNIFAIQGIIHTLFFVLSNILFLVFLKMRIKGYLLSVLISHMASVIYMFIAGGVIRDISVRFFDNSLLRVMLLFSIPLIPASVAWWIMSSIDRYMLLYMCGPEANGLYSVAHKLPTVITTLSSFFINAWQISAVRNMDDQDISEYTSKIFHVVFLVLVVLSFGMILSSKLLGRLFFSKDFFEAWTLVPVLTLSTSFSALSLFLGAQFTAHKRSKWHLQSNLIAMTSNIIFNYWLITKIGLSGAAFGTMLSYFVVLIYRHILTKRLMALNVNIAKYYSSICILMVAATITSINLSCSFLITLLLMVFVAIINIKDYTLVLNDLLHVAYSKVMHK